MKELSEKTIAQIIQGNAENLNLEFKSTFDFVQNLWARERLIRSILAFSNTRNGGYIVIGVGENGDKSLNFAGIEKEHLALFRSKAEDLKSIVESFSSAPINYEIGIGKYKKIIIILISIVEFYLNPIICRKKGKHASNHLEEGAIYIRTLKDKPSSIKLTNSVDIQDFLERVSDKQILNLHKRGWKHNTENLKKIKSNFKEERSNF